LPDGSGPVARPSGPQPDHSPLENAARFPHLTAESDQQHHAAISFFGGLIVSFRHACMNPDFQ
jgi:hypothetical protein